MIATFHSNDLSGVLAAALAAHGLAAAGARPVLVAAPANAAQAAAVANLAGPFDLRVMAPREAYRLLAGPLAGHADVVATLPSGPLGQTTRAVLRVTTSPAGATDAWLLRRSRDTATATGLATRRTLPVAMPALSAPVMARALAGELDPDTRRRALLIAAATAAAAADPDAERIEAADLAALMAGAHGRNLGERLLALADALWDLPAPQRCPAARIPERRRVGPVFHPATARAARPALRCA